MTFMTYQELEKVFIDFNQSNNVRQQAGDKKITGVIVLKKNIFDHNDSLEVRSYIVSSDNKRYIPGMLGSSIFGTSLDGAYRNVRLDHLIKNEGNENGLEVEYCYLKDKASIQTIIKTYDIVLCEKPENDGVTIEEIQKMYAKLSEKEAYPLDIPAQEHESAAIGFITSRAADYLNFNMEALGNFVAKILDDMEEESLSCEYSYKDLTIYLSRNF